MSVAFVALPYERSRIEQAMPKVRELVPDARIISKRGAHWVTGTVPKGTTARELIDVLSLASITPLDVRIVEPPSK